MTTQPDLRQELKRAAEPAEREAPPPVEALIRRGRRRRVLRTATTALAAVSLLAGVLGSLIFVGRMLRPPGSETPGRGDSLPASPDRGTYILSDFTVEHPFNRPGTNVADRTLAGVSFTATWSTELFPGQAQCHLFLKDAAGIRVGEESFLASYIRDPSSAPPIRVEVSASPVTADGMCEPGVYPPGPGYTFENVQIGQGSGGESEVSTITFVARWVADVHPGYRSCQLHVIDVDGDEYSHSFGLDVSDGAQVEQSAPVPPDQVRRAWITCAELREAG